ncbi:MAG: hypothetical protein WCS49_02430 [Bacilli bacterium]
MPICRNCGARISKFDKDICPICGAIRPLDGVNSETVEVTSEIDVTNPEFANAKPKSKKVMILLFCLVGFSGAPFFYLKEKKLGFLWLLLNLLILGGLGVFLYFITSLTFYSFIISTGFVYLINIILGIVYFKTNNLKDGVGEFVR